MRKLLFLLLLMPVLLFSQSKFATLSNNVTSYENVRITNNGIQIGHKYFRRKLMSERKFKYLNQTFVLVNTKQGFSLTNHKQRMLFEVKGIKYPQKRLNRPKILKGIGIGLIALLTLAAINR